jgi:hypothetical protein
MHEDIACTLKSPSLSDPPLMPLLVMSVSKRPHSSARILHEHHHTHRPLRLPAKIMLPNLIPARDDRI